MKTTLLKIKVLREGAVIPKYATDMAAGFDLAACESTLIFPGQTVVVKTGLAFEIQDGYEVQIRPRSGISLKTPLIMKNSPGTIDSDYRGEVGIIMYNMTPTFPPVEEPFIVQAGDRIAQGVLKKVERAEIRVVKTLTNTARGEGGYGHTGVKS